MITRTFLAAGATLLAAAPAFAGGFTPTIATPAPAAPVVVAPAPVAPVSVSDWSGFYVGGQLAAGRLNFSGEDTNPNDGIDDSFDFENSGVVGGIHAGYMFDFGRFVAGAEIAVDGSNIGNEDDNLPVTTNLDWVGRLGVRAGYDAGRFLPYLTAGLSRASFSYEDNVGNREFDDDTADGTYFGGGVEYAVNDRFSVGAEVLRHSFDLAEEQGLDSDAFDTDLTTVGVRASWHF
jgi:outer membrane immunogenic protein